MIPSQEKIANMFNVIAREARRLQKNTADEHNNIPAENVLDREYWLKRNLVWGDVAQAAEVLSAHADDVLFVRQVIDRAGKP